MAEMPATNQDLLNEPIVAHLATVRPDGSPQCNPVWFEWDGEYLKITQTTDRQKVRNFSHEKRVALSLTDPKNPYRYLEVRGEVERTEEDPQRRFIDHLSERYLGTPYPYHQPQDRRVTLYIRPTGYSAMGA